MTWNTAPAVTTTYASQSYAGPGYHRWNVTSFAQQWKTGALANRGLLIKMGGTVFGSVIYTSHEGTFTQAPRLKVEYVTQGSPAILPVQADTWINQALPSTNYGADPVLYVARVSGNARNALVKFDTSSLPSTTVIISAALEVYSEINLANGPDIASQIYADAILSNWNETTVTWASKPVTQSMGDPSKGYEVGWLRFDVSNIARAWFSGTIANEGIQLRLDPAFSSGGQLEPCPAQTPPGSLSPITPANNR